MSADTSHGIELVLELVRESARDRCCPACGRALTDASITPESIDPERVVASMTCPCGATQSVEVRPTAPDGRAEIR